LCNITLARDNLTTVQMQMTRCGNIYAIDQVYCAAAPGSYLSTNPSHVALEKMMNTEDDRAYFDRRARQERLRAEATEEPFLKRAHLRMAEAYERRVREMPVSELA